MLGDIVISIDTAARQAKERAHTLLDEMRILVVQHINVVIYYKSKSLYFLSEKSILFFFSKVHGLLHLLGFDHEIGDEAEEEMEKEEELILGTLGWKGKGLIKSAYDSNADGCHQAQDLDGKAFLRPIFPSKGCDCCMSFVQSLKSKFLYEGLVV